MKLVRLLVVTIGLLLMTVGYAISQQRFFQGATKEYIDRLDGSPVPMLSLVLLLAAVALAFVPAKPEEDENA